MLEARSSLVLVGTLLSTLLASSAMAQPPVNPVLHTAFNPTTGSTYHLLQFPSSWADAEQNAIWLGGHLATVNDEAENKWIFQNFQFHAGKHRDLWIGLNDVANEGTFVWASGAPVSFTKWALGEPSNYLGFGPDGEDFVALHSNAGHFPAYYIGHWNDFSDKDTVYPIPIHGLVEIECGGLFSTYGQGCAGSGGFTPQLNATGCPESGNQVSLEIAQGLGGASALLVFGLGQGSTDLGGGCFLLLNPVLPAPVLLLPLGGGGPGTGSLLLPGIMPPNLPPLTVTMQAFVFDQYAPIGAAASNGLQLTIY